MIATGGAFAAAGAVVRAVSFPGSGRHSAGYLLDALGWIVAIAGAVVETSAASTFLEFAPKAARRRALLLLLAGVAASLLGCVLATSVVDRDAPAIVQGAAMWVMVAGIGAALAGCGSLAWHYGGEYAGRRIEKLDDEDW